MELRDITFPLTDITDVTLQLTDITLELSDITLQLTDITNFEYLLVKIPKINRTLVYKGQNQ